MIRERARSVAFGAHIDQHRRLLIAASLGAVATTAASIFFPWQLRALVGWDVAAAFVVGSVWTFIVALDAEATGRVATREDDSRTAVDLIMVIASVVSLVGVVIGLAHARDHHGVISSVLTGVAVFTAEATRSRCRCTTRHVEFRSTIIAIFRPVKFC